MCGITAYKGPKDAGRLVFEGLKKLEYRGYDSWGIAWADKNKINVIKKIGKVGNMGSIKISPSNSAIAHTRWATHGGVEEKNAHPHISNNLKIAVVHNGIIENHTKIRQFLKEQGFRFSSDTDTEVIPNLIQHFQSKTADFQKAFESAVMELDGSYALVAIDTQAHLAFARKGSPLCIGLAQEEYFLASDVSAFHPCIKNVIYLEEGDYGFINGELTIKNLANGGKISRTPKPIDIDTRITGKQGYSHFMLKEIYEQPEVIKRTIAKHMDDNIDCENITFKDLPLARSYLNALGKITLIACGTAYYACLVSKYMLEALTALDVEVDFASEFRYRSNTIKKDELYLFISQSGETADTLAAMRKAKSAGAKTISVVNVPGSTLARESEGVIYTNAGPEIGVASTKAFVAQLTTMLLFWIHISSSRQDADKERLSKLTAELRALPIKAESALHRNLDTIKLLSTHYKESRSFMYVGRALGYPIALEGALKLKELSYIHAEGFPAGELKHGAIALIDRNTPSVCIIPNSRAYPKMLSNIEEIKARGGPIICIATENNKEIKSIADHVLYIDDVDELLAPILAIIPLQLFAYYLAAERGCDIDQPRNLAKSVTVE